MLLARSDPDRTLAHRGLSLFVVEKPRGEGHGFVFTRRRPIGPPASARAGSRDAHRHARYRGMHSYELSFEDWFVPEANLVGGPDGLGRASTSRCRLRERAAADRGPGARLMQAAYEAAAAYAANRRCSARRSATTN